MLWCLHGNFGLPSDWEFLGAWAEEQGLAGLEVRAISIWNQLEALTHPSIEAWVDRFLSLKELKEDSNPVLIGYSLGARLALTALTRSAHPFKAAVLVSCHPGGLTAEQRAERYAEDIQWARECSDTSIPFPELMLKWNQQSVFQAARSYYRSHESGESAASNDDDRVIGGKLQVTRTPFPESLREQVARAFLVFSLAKVPYSPEQISDVSIPVLWVVGEEDRKFIGLSDRISSSQISRMVIKNAGHRVPWENPEEFLASLGKFFRDVGIIEMSDKR